MSTRVRETGGSGQTRHRFHTVTSSSNRDAATLGRQLATWRELLGYTAAQAAERAHNSGWRRHPADDHATPSADAERSGGLGVGLVDAEHVVLGVVEVALPSHSRQGVLR